MLKAVQVFYASGTPVGALDAATTVNEPSYYKELRQYDLHGYSSTKLMDANDTNTNTSGMGENIMDDVEDDVEEDVEDDVEEDVEEGVEAVAEVALNI